MDKIKEFCLASIFIGFIISCKGVYPQKVVEQEIIKPQKTTSLDNTQEDIVTLKKKLNNLIEENRKLKEEIVKRDKYIEELQKKERVVIRMPTGQEIQQALKNAGFYTGDIDGIIGYKTKEAIKKFQEKEGLTVDGVVGSSTWERLRKYLDIQK